MDVKGVEAVRKALLKWRHFLPWTLLLCLASGCLMAAYTWAYEADRYQAVYTFYAAPEAAASQKAPLEAARMLARDCHALTRTDGFRQAVLSRAASDGQTRAGVRGIDGTHMLEVVAIGPDPASTAGLADAIGRELVACVQDELGAAEVIVFSSRFCAAYMNEKKLERLRRVAREAAEQCRRATVPAVRYFGSLPAALEACADYKNKLFACEFAERSEADLRALSGSCALVVGSEGGFAEEEFAAARAAGFAGVTLGRRILRAETAAIAFTAVVAYLLGELG